MREAGAGDEAAWTDFAARLSYIPAEYDGDDLEGYAELARRFEQLDRGTGAGRLFYLATPPALFAPIMKHLSDAKLAGLAYQHADGGWARFVIEKPFGHDLASARYLNTEIARLCAEDDIYRIDHFLGKEIVQNLFALRFANGIFEPVWNRNYIAHVQITASETLGMEGRGGYYENAGAMRDMVQNHQLQLCALVAIEPPAEWNPRAVRDEKVKALRAVRKINLGEVERDAVRGQYAAGVIGGERVPAYREEQKVAADSQVETYAALKLHVDNVRWAGVPFYLRSGKRLAKRATEIVVEFKPAPHTPWSAVGGTDERARPNLLVVNVSPEEGIVIRVEAKQPGQEMRLQSINLDYCRSDEKSGATEPPSAYEHLLLDSLSGDPTFFARADEVEAAWEIVEPVIEKWGAEKPSDFSDYAAGSSGPAAADELLARDGRYWYDATDQAGCKINLKDADSSRAKGAERYKDGIVPALLAAEITARMGRDPGEIYRELTSEFGDPLYERIDAPATPAQKAILQKLSPDQIKSSELAGEKITAKLTTAPGNGEGIGGLKVTTKNGWFAARPSGTENVYKIYAESFRDAAHLRQLQEEAQSLVAEMLTAQETKGAGSARGV